MAVQPVVRKAELLRGGCTEEEANFLNGRSLMTLASGIANGYGCVLFPEGTSHNNSYMLRFRTGPMRTVLAAGALAATSDKPLPVLIPLGLHFRQKEHFRTDVWVEYGKPIQVDSEDIPDNLIEAVRGGTWSEPPAESVFRLRDNLRDKLVPLSPDVNSWEEYRGLQLLGHIKGRLDGNAPNSWSHEVKLARHFRKHFSDENRSLEADNLQPPKITHPLVEKAEQAADILHNNGLDGRDLNDQSCGLRRAKLIKTPLAISRIALFVLLSPVFLLSLLPQIALGRILGDSTDEGIDARTSYQFLAAMFGSITIWPISSTIMVALLFWQSGEIDTMVGFDWTTALGQGNIAVWSAIGILWLLMFPVSLLTGRLFSLVWDDYVDLRGSYRRARFSNSDKQELVSLLGKIKVELADFD